MLKRVSSLSNEVDRIRLFRLLFSRFDHDPEWYLENLEELRRDGFCSRFGFKTSCIGRLVTDRNSSSDAIFAGWNLARQFEERLDVFKTVTREIFAQGPGKWDETGLQQGRWHFAAKIRDMNELYFKFQFADEVYLSYDNLPEEHRPAFVEQIKRDFFHRPEMKFVDRSRLPEAFRQGE